MEDIVDLLVERKNRADIEPLNKLNIREDPVQGITPSINLN